MNPGNRVEIVDRDGWRKEFPLEKPLIYIGSDAGNEIPLHVSRGGGVAPRHLQLIALPGDRPGYRAINLGDTDVVLGDEVDRSLAPRSATEITDGARFQVGDFTLLFRLGGAWAEGPPREGARPAASSAVAPAVQPSAAPAGQRTSASIGLRLSLPRSVVDPDSPLEGIVAVRNLGNEPGVQFRLEVDGLEPDWYEIGSGPILFPNVEKGVRLRIRHPRGPGILAGRREISICCTAPEAYPGESVTVAHVLEILPFYHHELRLISTD
jgi:hypothetical protein